MIRRCTGQDSNLLKALASGTPLSGFAFSKENSESCTRYEPCNCGLEFDDAAQSVIYPHHPLPKKIGQEISLP